MVIMKKYLQWSFILSLACIYGETGHADECSNESRCCKPCTAVFLSSPSYSFEIHGSALYMQPTGSNLHYAAEAIPIPVPSPDWNIFSIDTDYHFGFDVGIAGICHCSNTNLMLNWEHFHSKDSASKQVSSQNMIGPFFEIGPDASAYTKAHGRVTYHFDEVDLDYGVFLQLGERLHMNWFGGVSFARIKQTLFSKYSNVENTIVRSIKVPSTFLGAGPKFGVNFCYLFGKGFHLVGETGASLLVGPQKNHTNYSALSPFLPSIGITPPNNQRTHVQKGTQVVPGFEGKLGLAYAYTFCNDVMLKFEAGYATQVYINAIRSIDMGSEVVTPPVLPDTVGVFARTFQTNLSNFALA